MYIKELIAPISVGLVTGVVAVVVHFSAAHSIEDCSKTINKRLHECREKYLKCLKETGDDPKCFGMVGPCVEPVSNALKMEE